MLENSAAPRTLRFAEFELDVVAGELRRAGTLVRLQEKPLQVLLQLLEHPGAVVTREALRRQLWPPDTFVDFDNSLNTAINKLRAALEEQATQPRFIESVARRGYRFIAPVERVEPRPSGTRRLPRTAIAGATAAVLTIVAIVSVAWHPRVTLPTGTSVVVADLANLTGDPVFEGTLKHTLAAKLGESPFFNIVSRQRVGETLTLMRRPADDRLIGAASRDLCRRVGAAAVVGGEIAALGSRYVITLDAVDCATGETLAKQQVDASTKEDVLGALDRGTASLRADLGESLRSIEARNTPLAQATTSSLDALKAFSLGEAKSVQNEQLAAIPFHRRAIMLDPQFALAYAKLGVVYGNRGEPRLQMEALTKAYELRDRVGERERFYISAHYYRLVRGEVERARGLYEVWAQTYPGDAGPHASLGLIYLRAGETDKAIQRFREAVRLDPVSFSYSNLTRLSLDLGRVDEARAAIGEWHSRLGDSVGFHQAALRLAFLDRDVAAMRRHAAAVNALPDDLAMVGDLAQALASLGRMREARELWSRQVESALRQGFKDIAGAARAVEALWEAEIGNISRARELVSQSLAVSPTVNVRAVAVITLARADDGPRADEILHQIDPQVRLFSHVRGWALLANGNPRGAVRVMAERNPYWGAPEGGIAGQQHELATRYARGQAHLKMRAARKAAEEFQGIQERPSIAALAPYHAFVALQLARAHALAGDTDQASTMYRRFLDRWANADTDLPVLRQANAEFTRLTAVGLPAEVR